jgi:DNA-binding NarL/FixJ family response regulator
MPGTDLIPAIRTLVERGGTRVLVFSAFDEPTAASSALGAGASGYVLKESSPAEIVGAIRKVSAGGRYVDPHVAASVLEELGPSATPPEPRVPLSQRETRVLQLVGMGYTGRQIAVELGVSEGTVDSFRHRIRRKLGLKSRSEVMAFARSSAGRGTRGPR